MSKRSKWTFLQRRNKDDTNRYTMFLDWKNQYCENDYPEKFTDSMQSLSNYQWHFSKNSKEGDLAHHNNAWILKGVALIQLTWIHSLVILWA